ncbi:bifunctional heptose 7-phosphate kinase/heptose 1-phosphate adenyltransferase [Hufsiella ginkgonis]|uniref:D-glycero-beta-D-manno-heptose-7-phosphate kinase n=1 Tax=Hufsiella ginkgonis TaxID=2695274 RepID=A0A7K1XX04_9SPHI|nr:bifunctional ADP-heptose synthase [Hufsiella ginkgonis]MXV15543.1 D-glycero-beta-D-manno-heptose-7-phosphate kinase [Hufsiella ginkgonis]
MKKLFRQFNDLTILVVGDVMLDTYLWGNVDRISPEAPVPVVSVKKKESRLGGAANVVLNVMALGATPLVCTAIGDDTAGDEILDIIRGKQLSDEGIIQVTGRPTTVKTRVIAQGQQIVRIDSETEKQLQEADSRALTNKIIALLDKRRVDAIIFEDYDKGVISPEMIHEIVTLGNQRNIITVVDPKKRNFLDYHNVTLFKPNLKELREGLKMEIVPGDHQQLEAAVTKLQKTLNASLVMVTLSEAGVYMSSKTDKRLLPAHVRDISDVSGAGDTVIATATCCLAAGADEFTAAAIANLAGGLVCEHTGVVPIDKEHLQAEASKILGNH